jgi:fibronectin-binding autotransporter adhesin
MQVRRVSNRLVTSSRVYLAALIGLSFAAPAIAQTTYTLNADGNAGNSPNPAVHLWGSAAWSPAGVPNNVLDTATIAFREFNNVDQTGDANIDIDLEGNIYSLNTLNFSEGTGNADGDFQNGTLNVSNINYTDGGREIDFESTLTINGGSNLLSISTTGNAIDFLGTVNGTGGILVSSASNFIRFNASAAGMDWSSIGGVTLRGNSAAVFQNINNAGLFVVDSLNINHTTASGNSKLELDRSAGSNGVFRVSGLTTIQPATGTTVAGLRMLVDFNDDNLAVDLASGVLLNNGGGGVQIASVDQIGTINFNGAIADGGANDVLTLNPHQSSDNIGTFNINVASPRTAATNLIGPGVVNLNVNNGLGTGLLTVEANSYLNLVAAQSAPNISVAEFGAIGGDNNPGTGAITLAAQNVIVLPNLVNKPTTAGGTVHYLGIDSATGTVTIGNDGNPLTTDDIYKGASLGAFTGTANYTGTVNNVDGTSPIEIYMHGAKTLGATGTTGTEGAMFATTGVVNFTGPGLLQFNEPDAPGITPAAKTNALGGADVFNRIGDPSLQNATIMRLGDANSLNAGQTLSITHGRLDLDSTSAVQDGAIVKIGNGATLFLDQNVSTGTFEIQDGGAIYTNSLAHLNSGATFNVTGNGLMVLDADITTSGNFVTVMQQLDIVLDDNAADIFNGAGIVLGNGKRLATPSTQSVDLDVTGTVGVSAAPGATNVIFSASSGDTLDINVPVNLAGVDLQIGSAPFTTVIGAGNMTRTVNEPQTGTVGLKVTTARSLDLQAGLLRLEPEAFAAVKDGSITTAVSGVGGFTRIRNGARLEIEYNQETDPLGIQVEEVFRVDGDHDPAASGGETFYIDRVNIVAGGNNIINLNNIVLGNGAQLAVDVEDTTATEARLSLHLQGSATTVQRTTGALTSDDYSLKDVRGANADGSPNTIAPRTLNIGFTPDGTNPGTSGAPNSADYVLVQSVFGTIDSNVTVNMINGQLNFENGSVVNGTVNANTRTGDFFIRLRGGQDGTEANRVTGTGQINLGHDTGTVIEDIAGFTDEVSAGNTGKYNASDLRINVLPSGGIIRSERGVDSDVDGTFHFQNVGLNESIAYLDSANSTNLVVDFVLNGNGIVQPGTGGSDDANRIFVGKITDPGTPSDLRVRGTSSIRFTDSIAAKDLLVGGSESANQSGRVVLQGNNTGSLVMPNVTTASLNLSGSIILGQGGVVTVDTPSTAGVILSGNGDLNINQAFTVPTGKTLAGTNNTAVDIGTSGSLTLASGAILAPGASPGTLTINGSLSLLDNAIYQYEIGDSPANSDLVNLTGTNSTVSFGTNLVLDIANPTLADTTGQTYVLFNYTGADPAVLPNILFSGLYTGTVSIDSANTQIILTDVVAIPEPSTWVVGSLAMLGLVGGLRHRRKRAAS